MKRLATVLLLAVLFGPPASAGDVIWDETPNADGSVQLTCGDTCAEGELVCVSFWQPGSKMLQVEDLIDEALIPWGQIDFTTAASVVTDRDELIADDVTGGERSEGPDVVAFGGQSWVRARYEFEADKKGYGIDLLMWLKKADIGGLRCSYRKGVDVDANIEALAVRQR